MTSRIAAVLAALLSGLACAPAQAADEVGPEAGALLRGSVHFPKAQRMSVLAGTPDSTRLSVAMGFDGTCTGGRYGELFASNVPVRETVRVRDGRFSARLSGAIRNFGGVSGRTASFHWRLAGRFSAAGRATATVTGTGQVRSHGAVLARCAIARPAKVTLRKVN